MATLLAYPLCHDGQGCRRCFRLDLSPMWGSWAGVLCTHRESCVAARAA